MAEIKKLLEKLAAWLNIPGQKKTKLLKISGTLAMPAVTTTSSRNK